LEVPEPRGAEFEVYKLCATCSPRGKVPLIAAGGVNQPTAGNLILAGAAALGVGRELIAKEAVQQRRPEWIRELAQRFLGHVKNARSQTAAWKGSAATRK
jgi:2-keto-3-deoxy-6-phosphogluconate aldolase